MPISEESRNVLEEMRKAGVDAAILAGLERELDAKPAGDKVVKDSLMAQATFNTYRNKKDQETQNLRNEVQRLASLQGASSGLEGDLRTQVEQQIAAKKDELIRQGYDVEQIQELVDDLLANPANVSTLDKPIERIHTEKEKEMPNPNPDPNRNYVDTKTFVDTMTTSLSNLAAGGINMNVEIARALREADKLGVELSDEKLNSYGDVLVKGLEKGKKPAEISDEHFGFQAARDAKQKRERDAELEQVRQDAKREALKEYGVTPRRNLRDAERNPNPILDRNKSSNERVDSRVKIEDVPTNKDGHKEVFRTRRFDRNQRRYEHTQNAVNRFQEVSKDYDDDGLFIGHRRQDVNV